MTYVLNIGKNKFEKIDIWGAKTYVFTCNILHLTHSEFQHHRSIIYEFGDIRPRSRVIFGDLSLNCNHPQKCY
jgi:hypothetical protein